jgi:hypothetical protein
VTVAVHCEVRPICTVAGVQEAATEVMAGCPAGGFSVIAAVAVFEVSEMLVAVSVTAEVALIVAGAV